MSALQYYEPDSLFLYSFVARSEFRDNKTPLCVQNVGLSIFSVFIYFFAGQMALVRPEFAQHCARICRTESDVEEVKVLEHEILL